ncbi:hypothetical protein PSI23_19835 [Xenorhabdus sp. XENO-10]|uniref:Uncharacterized protein n=1 Tax=Xenorhabdus yunnanensis TaxID=3025878 RepID=A0ABT5LKD5_9GAMM|nr:hypothetical protein [Xenorhabdus yunnanensis]MDC9591470.1 hypothetical protein [Xenorhabdus yunnanensis]
MKKLQKAIHKHSANLKNQKDQKASNLLEMVRGGEAPAEIFWRTTWDRK